MNRFLQTKTLFLLLIIPVLVGILILFFTKFAQSPSLSITTIQPTNGAINQSLFPIISVSFSRAVSPDELSKIYLTTTPQITGDVSWTIDKKTVNFKSTKPLSTSTSYRITIHYGSYSKTWLFKTADNDNLSPGDEEMLQGIIDFEDGKQMAEFYKKNPWYDDIPIDTTDYFIGYDSQRRSFFVYLYPNEASSVSINTQIADLKSSAAAALKNIGVFPNPNSIEWVISQNN